MASEGLLRAAASARQLALQTGKPTKIVIKKNVEDCGRPVAWAVTQTDSAGAEKSLSCLSSADFAKRYKNTTLSFEGSATEVEIEFAPTGIGDNLNSEPGRLAGLRLQNRQDTFQCRWHNPDSLNGARPCSKC